MSSFLKHVDPETGKIVEDTHHDRPLDESDPHKVLVEARAHAERVIVDEIQRIEDAYIAALREAKDRAEAAEAELAEIQAKHESIASELAESKQKLAVLHELKEKLSGF